MPHPRPQLAGQAGWRLAFLPRRHHVTLPARRLWVRLPPSRYSVMSSMRPSWKHTPCGRVGRWAAKRCNHVTKQGLCYRRNQPICRTPAVAYTRAAPLFSTCQPLHRTWNCITCVWRHARRTAISCSHSASDMSLLPGAAEPPSTCGRNGRRGRCSIASSSRHGPAC